MTHSPLDEVTNVMKDAAYVSVGLGVIAYQRLQVRRHELSQTSLTDLVEEGLRAIERRLGDVLVRR